MRRVRFAHLQRKNYFKRAMPDGLRAVRHCIFTGGGRQTCPQTLNVSQNLSRHAKGSPFGRAGIEQSEMTERARLLKVADAVFLSKKSNAADTIQSAAEDIPNHFALSLNAACFRAELAPAVILPIQAIFLRELQAAQIAVVLFEV